uniref:peptide chain release factor N(5)-glutamine methyltransferase n=1 Tax=Pseudo-nitzschia delicatissima TaxID=44447 RepID=A0A7S0UKF5_9STRA
MTGWTVRDALDESIERLTKKNVTEPDYSALYLMATSLELPWERGIRDLDNYKSSSNGLQSTLLTDQQASHLEKMLKLRENHEPIQYVLGQWDFLDYTIAIRKPLLCPRPETEEMVMMVAAETKKSRVRILDVGCGTGVIGISLAEILDEAQVEAIDVEPIAVETSMENAQRVLKKDSGCYQATLVSANDYTVEHPFDVVVSNPPYIPRSDMDGLSEDVTRYESDTALCGGIDGMDVIKTIIRKLPEWCNSGAVCWMEVDPTHPKLIEEYLSSRENESEISERAVLFESSHQDMFGKDRFVKLVVT